jgi:hypothetical protein
MTYRIGRRSILVAQPHQKEWLGSRWGSHGRVERYVLWFGAYGQQYVLCYSHSLEDALEQAAEALYGAGMLGYFAEPEMEDGSTHDCPDAAEGFPCTCDLTYTESGYIPGWEWGIALEAPTREQLIVFHRGDA